MSITIVNPYLNDASTWLRGNLHAHTNQSDGVRDPQRVVDEYAARGYDFLMISDHDRRTELAGLEARGMALIPGNEVTADGPHLLHVDAHSVVPPDSDRQVVINAIRREDDFAVISHPNWERSFAHCPQEGLERWTDYAGIEIYNGVVRRLEGSPQATDRWDRLLGLGRRVWGFADDDSHRDGDDGVAWNMVQSTARDRASIVRALREGRFYASTGVTIERIQVRGCVIGIETADAERIVAYSDFGHRESAVDGPAMTFTVPEDPAFTYVRFECWGRGERMAWTQPFFIERR